ncbi:carbon-nitrogen hydrolase family protein [Staphylococcus sp. KY49P]|nr:carbon-nitrogen hydrolase family protein [Staphylococcus sp. KY49P]
MSKQRGMFMKISIAQMEPMLGRIEINTDYICRTLIDESQKNVDLVLFPELAISGYIQNSDLLKKVAMSDSSEFLTSIVKTCKNYNIDAVISFPEIEKDKYYIATTYIDATRGIIAKYRKTHLFADEQLIFDKGNDFPVINTRFGKVGLMICYDLEFPEVARLLKLKGSEIILISTANMSPYEFYQDIYLASRALENELPIAIANQYGINEPHHFFGHSSIVNHKGENLLYLKDGQTTQNANVTLKNDLDKDLSLDYVNQIHPNMYQMLLK